MSKIIVAAAGAVAMSSYFNPKPTFDSIGDVVSQVLTAEVDPVTLAIAKTATGYKVYDSSGQQGNLAGNVDLSKTYTSIRPPQNTKKHVFNDGATDYDGGSELSISQFVDAICEDLIEGQSIVVDQVSGKVYTLVADFGANEGSDVVVTFNDVGSAKWE